MKNSGESIFALQDELEMAYKPDINVSMRRYDELIKKEATLEMICKVYEIVSGYQFRDTVGYLLGKVSEE